MGAFPARGGFCQALVAGALAALLCTCSREPAEGRADAMRAGADEPPLLLLAVDGLEWSVLLPLVQAGELPAIAAQMERGTFGALRSMVPTASPVIWTTIATGKGPRQHGITGFVYSRPSAQGEELRVFTSGQRQTKAFWNILSDAGIPVDVIGWWVTYPAEPVLGLMVAQTNTTAGLQPDDAPALLKGSLQAGVEGQVFPREREDEVLAILGAVDEELPEIVARLCGQPTATPGEVERILWEETRWSLRADETYLRVAEQRLREPPAVVTAVYLGAPDVIGHRFWRHAHPAQFESPPAPEQVEAFGGLLAAAYRRVDRALAALLERMPEETRVLIVSDHGMHACNRDALFSPGAPRPELLSGDHLDAPPGVLIAAGSGFGAGGPERQAIGAFDLESLESVGSVLDVLPTLLVLLGLPVGEDMDGGPMPGVLDPQLLTARPPRSVPTHDTPQWLREHEAFRVDSRDLEERLEQLRALGYVR